MDPENNLQKQLQLAKNILRCARHRGRDAEELAELVLALDEWLSQGGFRPSRWQRQQK
jgi:hypothetical protein